MTAFAEMAPHCALQSLPAINTSCHSYSRLYPQVAGNATVASMIK